jgi:hypothetical protein
MPVTTPDEPTEAMVGALLVHVPPVGVAVNVMVEPTHNEPGPEIDAPE